MVSLHPSTKVSGVFYNRISSTSYRGQSRRVQDPILLWGSLGSPWAATPKEISHAYHCDICVVTQDHQDQHYLDLQCIFLLTSFNLCFLIDLENSFHLVFSWILLWINPPTLLSRLSHPTYSSLFKHFCPKIHLCFDITYIMLCPLP